MELFELIATTDVRTACDLFAPVHEQTNGADGYVSIEVSPGAANDAEATISEGTRLWATVDRPNVMIKVPGTVEGAKAVRQLIANGINVNITLLFAIDAYKSVIEAYMAGLEDRVAAGKDDQHDSLGRELLREPRGHRSRQATRRRREGGLGRCRRRSSRSHGKAAIANAKLAYKLFQEQFAIAALEGARRAGRATCSGRSGPARARRIRRIAT